MSLTVILLAFILDATRRPKDLEVDERYIAKLQAEYRKERKKERRLLCEAGAFSVSAMNSIKLYDSR